MSTSKAIALSFIVFLILQSYVLLPQGSEANGNSEQRQRTEMLNTSTKSETSVEALAGDSPSFYQISEYFIGRVSCDLIYLESDGTIDPNKEDWTSAEKMTARTGVVQGINWWLSQCPNGCAQWVTGAARTISIGYEPINRPWTDAYLWINQAMNKAGIPDTPDKFWNQTFAYANGIRNRVGSDWAFLIFMVDSSNDGDGFFAGGSMYSWTMTGGPYMVMSYKNNGWGPGDLNRTMAHELGHIFYATDEDDGTSEYSGYLNVCDIEGSGGVMCGRIVFGWFPSAGTMGQIGWRDSDGDGLQDIIDRFPDTILNPYSPDPTTNASLTYTGTVKEVPYPNSNPYGPGEDVTINKITSVQFRVDGESWQNATSNDGAFDEAEEDFNFTTPPLPPGAHTVEARGINSVGNIETPYASDEVMVIGADIAVIGLSLSKTVVGKGYSALVNVTVENQGSYTESFDVTAYYGNATITPEQCEIFWGMGDVNRDGYINDADGNLLMDALGSIPGDPWWCSWCDLNQDLIVDPVDVEIWMNNNGLDIWAYFISGAPIGTQTVLNLPNGSSLNITFMWNTIGIAEGNYAIGAYAVPVFWEEVIRADNGLSGGSVIIAVPGDVDGDGLVNDQDLALLDPAYSSTPLSLNWNPNCDINGDNKVDALDLYILGKNYVKTEP